MLTATHQPLLMGNGQNSVQDVKIDKFWERIYFLSSKEEKLTNVYTSWTRAHT